MEWNAEVGETVEKEGGKRRSVGAHSVRNTIVFRAASAAAAAASFAAAAAQPPAQR